MPILCLLRDHDWHDWSPIVPPGVTPTPDGPWLYTRTCRRCKGFETKIHFRVLPNDSPIPPEITAFLLSAYEGWPKP